MEENIFCCYDRYVDERKSHTDRRKQREEKKRQKDEQDSRMVYDGGSDGSRHTPRDRDVCDVRPVVCSRSIFTSI